MFPTDDRALNEQIALVLMVAVAFVGAGAIFLAGADIASLVQDPPPQAEFGFAFNASSGVVAVTHEGGATIDAESGALSVVVRPAGGGAPQNATWVGDGSATSVAAGSSFSLNASNSPGTADATYPPGLVAGDVVQVVWTSPGGGRSAVLARYEVTEDSNPAVRFEQGVAYEYYEADSQYSSMPDFSTETPTAVGGTGDFDISVRERDSEYAFRFRGHVVVPEDGQYTFSTSSDDGSELYIDGARVVDNRGLHGDRKRSGTVTLTAGYHPITVTHFEHTGNEVLDVTWAGPSFGEQPLGVSALRRQPILTAAFTPTCAGLNCSFDASASTDESGAIQEYRWDFGDGTTTTTTGPTVDHEYGSTGDRTVTLTVLGSTGATETTSTTVTAEPMRAPDATGPTEQGLEYEHYDGNWDVLPDFDALTPTSTGETTDFDIFAAGQDDDTFAYRYTGYVEVPEDGEYTFWTGSDDGSALYIGDEQVVNNDGAHPYREESGTIDLETGTHEITVTVFERTGQESLEVFWAGPSFGKQEVPTSRLVRNQSSPAIWDATEPWASPAAGGDDGDGRDRRPDRQQDTTSAADTVKRSPAVSSR
ncbi:PA14 domain-containing protein [Haloarchaeobius amylolyticus]|uniref:PA14 domain-containing protein n=1 Tax=Haloarchaeobius amylolyticus TaxID=1198296 RepID=UPI00226EBDEC|nr:PA14 domain-containing protein [Haloarchaeobius amylolyticus]